jgi:hypothetical protein
MQDITFVRGRSANEVGVSSVCLHKVSHARHAYAVSVLNSDDPLGRLGNYWRHQGCTGDYHLRNRMRV